MKISRFCVYSALVFWALSLLGFSLVSPLGGPDDFFRPADWAGLGILFFLWILFLFRLGIHISFLLKVPVSLSFSLAFGMLAVAYFPLVFSFSEIVPPVHGIVFFFVFGLSFLFSNDVSIPRISGIERDARIPAALGFFGIVTVFLLSCFPDPNPDALWYHLPFSRFWVQNSFPVSADHWIFLHSGLFDHLYFWPQIFFRGENAEGLIHAHIFSQWIHFCSFLCSVFLARKILETFEIKQSTIHWILLFAFSVPPLLLVSYTAKNDFGSLLWILSAVYVWRNLGINGRKEALLVFGFLGAAFSAKFTAIFTIVPFALWILFAQSRQTITGIASFGIFSFPILVRNYSASGNPIFPLAKDWIPTVTPYVWENTTQLSNQVSASTFYSIGMELLMASPLTILLPFLFFDRKMRPLLSILFFTSIFFILAAGELTLLRWFGGILVVLCGIPVLGLCMWLQRRTFASSLILAMVFLMNFIWFYPWKNLDQKIHLNPAEKIRLEKGGNAFAFLRLNYPKETVAVMDSNRLYYLPNSIRVWDSLRFLHREKSPEEFLEELKNAKIRFLLFTNETIDLYQDKELLFRYRNFLESRQIRKVFSENGAEIYEI